MEADEIRKQFLQFFKDKGHKIIPSSSLVPENDFSVLFTTAGMQQFKPYYTNPDDAVLDFESKNVATVQKCVRTGDIEEVGDDTHLTFFEMLGNFSFGGYGRKEAIKYAYHFITKKMNLNICYVTVYKGEGGVPKDNESLQIWKDLNVVDIRMEGSDLFWGPTGDSGPCGPTTEIYCKNANNEEVEIWNIVFNEYFCDNSRIELDKGNANLKKLKTMGIDTGMGLERLTATIQKKKSIYETDLFSPILEKINKLTNIKNDKAKRIIADHMRSAVFMIIDGITPSNSGRGYILRRLIRRVVRYGYILEMEFNSFSEIIDVIIERYKDIYPDVLQHNNKIKNEITKEGIKFKETLNKGIKEFKKNKDAFVLFTTYGFPLELSLELAKEEGININIEEFNKKMKEHKKLSSTASVGMFKGGLANHKKETIKLHTAHHLLLAALQDVIGSDVKQRGSNINENRLRLDFICDHKLTEEEKKKIEDWVNNKIKIGLNVIKREMPLEEAKKIGAEMEFGAKYPEIVSLYFIEDKQGNVFSKEFCGGPHVGNTSELGMFKIKKEESVARGIRRIKAILL